MMGKHFLSLVILLALVAPISGVEPETIEQAINQVKAITDVDPAVRDRKRAEAALRIVQNRMKVINDVSGNIFQTLPIDVWNKFSPEGNIKTRAEVLDFVRAKGWDLARAAWVVRAGACDEHAAVMQTILRGAGVNVTVFRSNSPHAFPVINLGPDADPDIPWTWGPDALVVDSWVGQAMAPAQTWSNRHFFKDGDCFVSDGTLTTREKLAEMTKRGLAFCEQNRAEYQRLYRHYLEIPQPIRQAMKFRPLRLPDLPKGALLVQVRNHDLHSYVSGATVLVTFPGKNEGLRTAATDGNGKVLFASIPGQSGKYDIHVVKQGFKKSTTAIELPFEGSADALVDLYAAATPALKVKLEWNTATDVDLWVIEPDGSKCYYAHKVTKSGATLHQDVTTGYGPEFFTLPKAGSGEYVIKAHYFSGPRDKKTPATQVRVTVTRNPGTPRESTQFYAATLRQRGDIAEICRLRFDLPPNRETVRR